MSTLLILTIVAVAIVLFFDYTNGFHDAANIVATIIASRAMTPAQAVIIVGTFEFLGPLLGGTAVANTIGKAQVRTRAITRKLRGMDALPGERVDQIFEIEQEIAEDEEA